jgi:hypothetical protein
MDFARVAVMEKAALLVVLASGTEHAPAPVAHPLFPIEVQIKIFSDSNAILRFG